MAPSPGPTFHLTTLGCSKNQVDSEKVTAMLAEAGYRQASSSGAADVVMVNTCAFIEAARQESIDTILAMDRSRGVDSDLVVIGCLAQRYGAELGEALEEIDAVVGLDRYGELVPMLDSMTGWTPVRIGPRRPALDLLDMVSRPLPSLPYAYVKVAEGCDKTCAFCAIP